MPPPDYDPARDIARPRRHIFCRLPAGPIVRVSTVRFDRLWLGYLDAAIPKLAGRPVRFAVFEVAPRPGPPWILSEDYPVLHLDDHRAVDQARKYDELQAIVDHLEAHDHRPPRKPSWRPDPLTRQHLLAMMRYRIRPERGRRTWSCARDADEPPPSSETFADSTVLPLISLDELERNGPPPIGHTPETTPRGILTTPPDVPQTDGRTRATP